MKSHIVTTEEDMSLFAQWEFSTPDNLLDPDIAGYPGLRILAVTREEQPKIYVPFHPVFMIESLAHDPDITPMQNARALKKAQDDLEFMATSYGIKEIYWQCGDKSLIDLAVRRGYEVVTNTVLRKKL